MADIGDQRIQPALHAMLAGDRDRLQQAIERGDTPHDVLDEAMAFAGTNDRAGAVDYRLDIGIDAGRPADRKSLKEDL